MEYMSQEGYDKLVAELHELECVLLPQVREAIAEARDKGDLSENFEYHAAKREQSRLLGRIRFKQKVLANARVIDMSRLSGDKVQLLSKVEMTNLALLNKTAGEEVEVRVPAGIMRLRIESIQLG